MSSCRSRQSFRRQRTGQRHCTRVKVSVRGFPLRPSWRELPTNSSMRCPKRSSLRWQTRLRRCCRRTPPLPEIPMRQCQARLRPHFRGRWPARPMRNLERSQQLRRETLRRICERQLPLRRFPVAVRTPRRVLPLPSSPMHGRFLSSPPRSQRQSILPRKLRRIRCPVKKDLRRFPSRC